MTSLTAEALNHLLSQSGWAQQRLAKYAGKTARFSIAPFSFTYTVLADGTVCLSENETLVDATCNIPPSLLPRLALQDEAAFSQIETSGDTSLLAEILFLSKYLHWDAAEDLSHITGDIVAERLIQLVATGQNQIHQSALGLTQAFAEYWTEERPLVAKSTHINSFVQQVDALRDDVARLEHRINRLTTT